MNTKNVETFLKIQPQLNSAYNEISLLSKKKPTDAVNKFKLKFINSIIDSANSILGKSYKPFSDEFDRFDEDDLPNNSDVVFILSHYLTSLEKLRCDNIKYEGGCYWWVIDGSISEKKTNHPSIR